ncbi:MAG: hypothetical protein KAI79_01230 [Bacteroidales bacterium]|nr:hypothetical protein [Bacteroidales bacterium]
MSPTDVERLGDEIMNPTPNTYSVVSSYTEDLEEETEKLVSERKLPKKDIIAEVSTTDMVIDLALASLAKNTALKLNKLERFLGKIEDQLFSDSVIKNMKPADLMGLYTQVRFMRTDSFKTLKDIRNDIDFDFLEGALLSKHSKESLQDLEGNEKMTSLLEDILSSSDFLDKAEAHQRKILGEDDD